MTELQPLMEQNYLEYASYVIVDRAIPDVRDGCKPVQRRILATLHGMDDGRFNKVANVVGESMKLHPHGDQSIYDALVVVANKDYFIERQGNFGSILTGHPAAAARYIECRLTDLARETLFPHKDLIEFQPSYDGRKEEPVWLPAKLPVVLLQGTDGIAVGMATKILPHNFCELLQAQIDLLEDKPIHLVPDFPQGGLMDPTGYADGRGKVLVRARIEADGDKRIVIREVPYGVTTESLINSIETAAQRGKVKIVGIHDYTTEDVEIEITLQRGVYAEEVIPQLYAYTDCEVSISSNLTVISERHPEEPTVTDVLHRLTVQLRDTLKRELEWELGKLEDKQHWLTLEQIFIENRVYKLIEDKTTMADVRQAVLDGMEPFRDLFIRDLVDEDVERLLEVRIRRISQFDIDKNRKDIDDIVKAIKKIRGKLRRMVKTTIDFLQDLLKRYGPRYPRRTEVTTFKQIDVRAVARSDTKVAYDPETGFFGTAIKGDLFQLQVSEYDKLLLICDNGSFRIGGPQEKVLLPGKLLHAAVFDVEKGAQFTVVYRDKQKNAWAKKVQLLKFINNREYELIKGREGKIDHLLEGDAQGTLHCVFKKAPRQRVSESEFNLAEVEFGGVGIRGVRVAPKPLARVKYQK